MPLESIEKSALQSLIASKLRSAPETKGHLTLLPSEIPIEELPEVTDAALANWSVHRPEQWGPVIHAALVQVEADLKQRYRLALSPWGTSFA